MPPQPPSSSSSPLSGGAGGGSPYRSLPADSPPETDSEGGGSEVGGVGIGSMPPPPPNPSPSPPRGSPRGGRGSGSGDAGEGDGNGNGGDGDGDGGDGDGDGGISLTELLYGTASYHAIALPVSCTMILAALAAVYANDATTLAEGEALLSQSYTVFDVGEAGQSAWSSAGLSLVNTLIIVTVIGGLTFGIVLLYRYRCMKFLIGYMVLSSSMLLGFLGGLVAQTCVDIYGIPVDVITFYFALWNFAVVGTVSIFYQKGIPTGITQT